MSKGAAKPKLAIIGAGMSGLVLARALRDVAEVTIFEKSRGVGGRMATRQAVTPDGAAFCFDHGVQCFTARTDSFQAFLAPFLASGRVAPWHGKVMQCLADGTMTPRPWAETHYVSCPHMTSWPKDLAQGLNILFNTQVAPLSKTAHGEWALQDVKGEALGVYDWVIVTAPPVQAKTLLAGFIDRDNPLANATLQGCFALMLGLNTPWPHEYMALRLHDNPVKWIWLQNAKPGRAATPVSIVIHSRNNWAEQNLERDFSEVEAILLEEFFRATGIAPSTVVHKALHRWRYAIVANSPLSPKAHSYSAPAPWCDNTQRLAATGDWAKSSRIEDVFLASEELVGMVRKGLE